MARAREALILSIIIPTLNEADRLPRLLGDLARLRMEHEIIVADGGSSDETVSIARARGCRVVATSPGRGLQLEAGIAAARGAVLLMLHADVRFSPECAADVQDAVDDPAFVVGAWPLRLDASGTWIRWLEIAAAWRWRLWGLAYGDQGLLIRREAYTACGGYPPLPIMEDVALARAVSRRYGWRRFPNPVVADARRYASEGRLRRALTNVVLLGLFLMGVQASRLARWYRPAGSS